MPMKYTPADEALRNAVTLRFVNGPKIEFQFPPKITSDGRKGEWKEGNLPGTEPLAAYQKSGPREITLVATYIVDGGLWTTERVSQTVRELRGYFARVRNPNQQGQRNLVVKFQMWRLGGDKEMSCRIKGVDIKHSDTIVSPCNGGVINPKLAYPLRTDITVDLRIWTKGGPQKTQNLEGLELDEVPEWY